MTTGNTLCFSEGARWTPITGVAALGLRAALGRAGGLADAAPILGALRADGRRAGGYQEATVFLLP